MSRGRGGGDDSWTPISSGYIPRAAFLRAEVISKSNTRPGCAAEEGQLMFAGLREGDPVRKRFWNFLLAKSFEEAGDPGYPWEQDSTFLLSGAWGLASWDPCAPMPSPCPREKHSLVTLGKSHHFSAPQFSPLQNGNEENLSSLAISGIVNN